jgi:hypothetical protein
VGYVGAGEIFTAKGAGTTISASKQDRAFAIIFFSVAQSYTECGFWYIDHKAESHNGFAVRQFKKELTSKKRSGSTG